MHASAEPVGMTCSYRSWEDQQCLGITSAGNHQFPLPRLSFFPKIILCTSKQRERVRQALSGCLVRSSWRNIISSLEVGAGAVVSGFVTFFSFLAPLSSTENHLSAWLRKSFFLPLSRYAGQPLTSVLVPTTTILTPASIPAGEFFLKNH